jgi:hypothetical protein
MSIISLASIGNTWFLAGITTGLFLTLLTLTNAIKSLRTHRQGHVSFDVQSFGYLPTPPTMEADLPETQVVASCAFQQHVPGRIT